MNRKVLVIEDEPIIAEMICIILEIEGLKVISLADMGAARQKLHDNEIGLVLLDLNLKGESGQTMCEYIKGQADLKDIPVILVSANLDLERIKMECGADDHIAKPFELIDFTRKVRQYALN
ncbi:response regulator transcription factor [Mucilaginibacter sp. HD30]